MVGPSTGTGSGLVGASALPVCWPQQKVPSLPTTQLPWRPMFSEVTSPGPPPLPGPPPVPVPVPVPLPVPPLPPDPPAEAVAQSSPSHLSREENPVSELQPMLPRVTRTALTVRQPVWARRARTMSFIIPR
jgi:hypothetical protein